MSLDPHSEMVRQAEVITALNRRVAQLRSGMLSAQRERDEALEKMNKESAEATSEWCRAFRAESDLELMRRKLERAQDRAAERLAWMWALLSILLVHFCALIYTSFK